MTPILFNLCGSFSFYHRCQNIKNRVQVFILTLPAEKVHFFRVLYKIGNKCVLEGPGIMFSHFCMNPVV